MGAGQFVPFRTFARLAALPGARLQRRTVLTCDLSGDCESPVPRTLFTRPVVSLIPGIELLRKDYEPGRDHVLYKDLETRCRRCSTCLRARSRMWIARAQAEIKGAARTWFATLTFDPVEQFRIETICRHSGDKSVLS